MIVHGTPRLILREWRDTDRDLFHEINSDSDVMEFFAFRRSREESDAALDAINDMIRTTGYGFYAMALRETNEVIGFCGIAPVHLEGIFPPGTLEIGWRLATRFWGKGYVTEAAKSLLAMAFDDKKVLKIVAFAVHDNDRSTAVMKRIGLTRDPSGDFMHPRVPDTHPHLKPHVTYTMTLERWQGK